MTPIFFNLKKDYFLDLCQDKQIILAMTQLWRSFNIIQWMQWACLAVHSFSKQGCKGSKLPTALWSINGNSFSTPSQNSHSVLESDVISMNWSSLPVLKTRPTGAVTWNELITQSYWPLWYEKYLWKWPLSAVMCSLWCMEALSSCWLHWFE